VRLRLWVALVVMAASVLARDAGAQFLYWVDTSFPAPSITRADADGNALTFAPLAPGSLPEGVAVAANGGIYWAEAAWSNAALRRSSATLASSVAIVSGGSALRGVVVDEVNDHVYWTSSNLITGSAIHRAGLDGSGATTVIALGSSANPRGIAVDAAAGKIYWADFDQSAIYRANLDGSQSGVWLAVTPGAGPYGVAFNPAGQHVYWTEYNAGTLHKITVEPGDVIPVAAGLANPTYIALDPTAGRIYWAEGGSGNQRIRRANLDGSGVITLPTPQSSYGGLAFQGAGSVSAPEASLPSEFALEPAGPSPGPGPVRVRFFLPHEAHVRLSVFDLQGREIAVLAEGGVPAGRHERTWDVRAVRGGAPVGMYFVRMAAAGQVWTRRVVVTR
jgi:DNA-binding beta-propeller fold protein YncE